MSCYHIIITFTGEIKLNKNFLHDVFDKWFPLFLCLIALVGGISIISSGYMVKEAELRMEASDKAWREDMAKSIAVLSDKLSSLENELSGLETANGDGLSAVRFEAEEYPVKYAFTEESAERFREFVLNVQLPAMKEAYSMSDEEYAETYASTEALTTDGILSSYYMDSVALGIELVDETVSRIGGLDGVYNVQDGKFYADGYLFGTIDDNEIVYSQNSYGVPMEVHFYREGGEKQSLDLKEKIDVIESRIRSVSSQLVSFKEKVDAYQGDASEALSMASNAETSVTELKGKHEELSKNVLSAKNGISQEISAVKTELEEKVSQYDSVIADASRAYDTVMEYGTGLDARITALENFATDVAGF